MAEQCLRVASQTFEVDFVGVTRSFDDEHGTRSRVPQRLGASFYEDPVTVLALALRKLQGHSRTTDDFSAPGLTDEIRVMLRALG